MKKIAAAIGALGLAAAGLWAQGLNPAGQTKTSWEEINFEFNSSILSDGYPSLLRLAELLGQHRDYRVKVTGHTDYVGSVPYNDKLAMARAESVKAFLVKYGAADNQISANGEGKRNPEVDNNTKEGRFMNRRVVLSVTDGTGKVITEGGISQVVPDLSKLDDLLKKQQECCDQILKRLDKLDDILAALKALQGDNARLNTELNDLRNQQNALKDQVANLPKPIAPPIPPTAEAIAAKVEEDEMARNKKFSNVGIDIGPTMGAGRTGKFTATAHGQFFTPFGASGMHALQAQGEYMYYPGRQEGQFDFGLVQRMGSVQAGAFASFKYLNFKQYQQGGALGQAAFMVDYIFNGGKVGVYGTKGFKNYAVLNSQTLAPGAFLQTYARVADQAGLDATFGVWGRAYMQGDFGLVVLHTKDNRPGASLRLIQPITDRVAFTAEAGYNETFMNRKDSGRAVVGLQFGGMMNPHDYASIKTPVPMEIPRIRYEIGTRRVGSSPPIADAGPNQNGVPAGTITLNGSGSYDPLGLTLTYQWVQIAGTSVQINNATSPIATFTATAGQIYSFRLTVKNTDNLSASATTTVSTASPATVRILQFNANPTQITAGQSSILSWITEGATSVSISTLGNEPTNGSISVSPTNTTTYILTATGPGGTVTASQLVTVSPVAPGNPQIIRFEANPLTITPGQSSTLSWTTTGAATVTISPTLGNQPVNGSASTGALQTTTTFTLTATSSDGKQVTAPITVTVAAANIPQIVVFTANPTTISAGQSSKLCWQVNGATQISISPGVGGSLNANDCATVSPTQTTTYTLTAVNGAGQIQANVTVNVGQVQIISFTANPPFSPVQGAPVVLSWQTVNATSVTLVGADLAPQTNLPVNGSLTINPMQNGVYTLTAYGPGGQTTSVSISIFVR
jgi:uncharacterized cupredoxin-like copper-binding protein